MLITKKIVADKIAAYLPHDTTPAQLVDWAEHAMMDDDFEEDGLAAIRSAVSSPITRQSVPHSLRPLSKRGRKSHAMAR